MIIFRACRILFMAASLFVLYGPKTMLRYRALLCLPILPILLLLYLFSRLVKVKVYLLVIRSLGGVFIKFAQLLATRADIVGTENALILSSLQDKVAPMPQETVNRILDNYTESMSANPFAQFDFVAVASASIAQVHRAVLHDGDIVAVKIMRSGIAKKVAQDLSIIKFMCKIISINACLQNGGINDLAAELESCINRELDFGMEAAHMDEFRQKVASKVDYVIVPKVYWRHCNAEIIVTEWIDGVSLSNANHIATLSARERSMLAERLLHFYLYQVYECGFFHADPHQGNILILSDGKIALVDFGTVGRLNDQEKRYMTMILYAFVKKDYDAVARIHREAGYITDAVDLNDFAASCRIMGETFVGLATRDVRVGLVFSELLLAAKRFGMRIQPQLLLFQKSLVMIEGVLFYLDDSINTWSVVEPWLEKWLIRNVTLKGIFIRTIVRLAEKFLGFTNNV